MSFSVPIKPPTSKEIRTIRILIVFGVLSFLNFFYWFFDKDLINNWWLYTLLLVSVSFDCLRVLYIWYHYWDMSIPLSPKLKHKPSVDVFTTYFPGEPYEMVTNTLLAIEKMNYPHTTYLCDEANDQYLKEFCLKHQIKHVTRNNRIDAKAGNINNALKIATGDIFSVLDPDHLPSEDFLDIVIPYFEDSSIGFVQTVQSYYNIYDSLVARGAAEQTYHFYGPVMMTMNTYGTVNAIGANCVFRRTAIDSIGGHAAGLSEDLHTAMLLHAKKWKSVYVPKVLTKGLAPDTLYAYYKQQLKWSRGTLELLFSVYPKLFKYFTTRQKLHYGILPLHYLSGFIILINFLIPIISLVTATTPWKGNIVNFTFLFLPVILSIVTIRLYAQKWVMKKSEYGIHLTGGLLLISVWWIYIMGCIYTVFRKNIPYLPTPKDGKSTATFRLLFPNIFFACMSITAVIYGLSIDLTPFSIIMSCFALLNAYFLLYSIWFEFEKSFKKQFPHTNDKYVRKKLAPLKHQFYAFWRRFAVQIVILAVAIFGFVQYQIENSKFEGMSIAVEESLNSPEYLGIFYPSQDDGMTNMTNVLNIESDFHTKFNLISTYVAWTDNGTSNFPHAEIEAIYKNHATAMVTWEPWIPNDVENPDNLHVFELILTGAFDDYILNIAQILSAIDEPVFLRFAHEFENPFYPWYVDNQEGFEQFKAAWKHVYNIFDNAEASNVRWIWNPWKTDHVIETFPGVSYVDWIGLNILNYGALNDNKKDVSFKELYTPFKDSLSEVAQLPIIITEMGSLGKSSNDRLDWIKAAFTTIAQQSEIDAVVLFYSNLDKNLPLHTDKKYSQKLDWTFKFNALELLDSTMAYMPQVSKPPNVNIKLTKRDTSAIKGVNFKKGKNWSQSFYTLSRNELLSDFKQMKSIGLNTIRFQDNKIYNYNVIKNSERSGVQISFGFNIPSNINWVTDKKQKNKIQSDILKTVKRLKHHRHIINWHIDMDMLGQINQHFNKLEAPAQHYAYLHWLQQLLVGMKETDASRRVVIDLEVSPQFSNHLHLIHEQISAIDAIGLIVKENTDYLSMGIKMLKAYKINYEFSQISTTALTENNIQSNKNTFYIDAWQDNHEYKKLSLSGLVDVEGKPKTDYFILEDTIKQENRHQILPEIAILKPTKLIFDKQGYTYQAMVLTENSNWINGKSLKGVSFDWSLIKCNEKGEFIAIKSIDTSATLQIKTPENWEFYRLRLRISNDKMSRSVTSTLNTPLYQLN